MTLALVTLTILSCTVALILTHWLQHHFQTKLLDIPNARSSHTQPTPRGGGLAFLLAFAATSAIASYQSPTSPSIFYLWLAIAPLAITGLLDDRFNLPTPIRYLIQIISASLAVRYFSAAFLRDGIATLAIGHTLVILLTLISFTALINFYNFMDGLDGLVASTTTVQLVFLAIYLQQPVWWLLSGALLGFLYWNWSPAKIFMGDVGSTVLGASVGLALLQSKTPYELATAAAIALPIVGDAVYTLLCRWLRGENIFQAHRSHLYQRLNQSGWSHHQVALTYLGFTIFIALLIGRLNLVGSFLSLALTLGAIAIAETYLRSTGANSTK